MPDMPTESDFDRDLAADLAHHLQGGWRSRTDRGREQQREAHAAACRRALYAESQLALRDREVAVYRGVLRDTLLAAKAVLTSHEAMGLVKGDRALARACMRAEELLGEAGVEGEGV